MMSSGTACWKISVCEGGQEGGGEGRRGGRRGGGEGEERGEEESGKGGVKYMMGYGSVRKSLLECKRQCLHALQLCVKCQQVSTTDPSC